MADRPLSNIQDRGERIPRCPDCGKPMHPAPYGWWSCPDHPWRMAPDKNLIEIERERGTSSSK